MTDEPVTILLVEDDDVDAEAVERNLKRLRIQGPVVRARDGVEALEMLRGTGGHAALRPPYLLLVDIRMPRLDGIGLVQAIRNDPQLARTVIFMLTTSSSERDKSAAYDWHVAGYIVKSSTGSEFKPLLALIESYMMIVTPPPAMAAAQS
ncbi:MAG TPA: response regulator [Steroidobacteraceae bacterium]|nr:response regulator [Steroidobacteraceae bacterium]